MPVIMKDNVQYAYTTKGTVFHTLSNAEYEALPESEKMNGDVYCIPDREPILNPDQVWAKIGTETLDIGDDLTDGVNQLNSSLATKSYIKTATHSTAISKDGYFSLADKQSDWANSKAIIFTFRRYGNADSVVVPTGLITSGVLTNAVYFYYGSAVNYIGISANGIVTMKSNIQDAVYTDMVFIY